LLSCPVSTITVLILRPGIGRGTGMLFAGAADCAGRAVFSGEVWNDVHGVQLSRDKIPISNVSNMNIIGFFMVFFNLLKQYVLSLIILMFVSRFV
jgi:hypothetical protein